MIVILGGGPAGMSCALWLKHLGLAPLIVERNSTLGGQLPSIPRVNRWILGLPGRTGPELARIYAEHVLTENIQIMFNTWPVAVSARSEGFDLTAKNRDGSAISLSARALVIAAGVSVKGAEIFAETPGFDLVQAAGLATFFPLDHLDELECLRGKAAAAVGGGDNAHCTALDLAQAGARVYLLMRSRPKAQAKIRAEVEKSIAQGRIVECRATEIDAFHRRPEGIELSLTGAVTARIQVERVFVRAGYAPNTEFLQNLGPLADLERDARGYLKTDAWKRASIPRVYAVGDIANPDHQAVVDAIADGALAARAIARDIDEPERTDDQRSR
jgi:thioredoxin reductase